MFDLVGVAHAQCRQISTEFGAVCDIAQYLDKIFAWLLPVLGGLALIMILYAGYLYMTSQGNQEQTSKAKDIIMGVISGILFLFLIDLLIKTIGIE